MPTTTFRDVDREKIATPRPPYRGDGYDEEPRPRRRSRSWLWLAIGGLAAVVGFQTWQNYPVLRQYGAELSQLSGVPSAMAALSSRLGQAEQKIEALPSDLDALKLRTDSVERTVSTGIAKARQDLAGLTARLRREVRAGLGVERQATEARFRQVEEAQRLDAQRAVELGQQNEQLRRQVAGLNARLNSVDGNLAREVSSARNFTAQSAQNLRREIRQTDQRVTDFTDRPRTRFEASRGQSHEIAPGILLHITRTDPSQRRFHGWMQLVQDGKVVYLRDQSMLQTVAFYTGRYPLRHDLIVTGLDKYGVTGYVVFPTRGESQTGDAAGSSTQGPS